ncbi:nuclear transport factor 2 family protein [Actinokineospora enzanensis]|uniref:nuclear transport factor 2 family protein n=1 Tax=Actinokineospora enzanensis TaxID=155975 RepID=UPI00037C28D3|nr:nuclear transport factor 2 family protein [Actinokineospora enzanensis]
MTTSTDQLRALTDRVEITTLIDRFFRALDERGLDLAWGRTVFTEDAHVAFPIGEHRGLSEIVAALADGMSRFGATQHAGSNYLVDVDGDRANVRWNAIQTHLPLGGTPFDVPFVSGGYYEGEVVRTADGWRFREQRYHIVWLGGQLPQP